MLLTSKRGLRILGIALMLSAPVTYLPAFAQDNAPAPDNTKANRDAGATADQQKENKSDRELARHIRKAVIADKSLSTYAHNVKIIAENGVVTLRGPVRSEEEKASIESKAKSVAGVGDVHNELTVAPAKN
jgi:osmotically-inducible protein OsmY